MPGLQRYSNGDNRQLYKYDVFYVDDMWVFGEHVVEHLYRGLQHHKTFIQLLRNIAHYNWRRILLFGGVVIIHRSKVRVTKMKLDVREIMWYKTEFKLMRG